jgi:hypothetical protein
LVNTEDRGALTDSSRIKSTKSRMWKIPQEDDMEFSIQVARRKEEEELLQIKRGNKRQPSQMQGVDSGVDPTQMN